MAINDYSFPLFPGATQGFNVRLGTTYPTSGTWNIGDMIINSVPATGSAVAWVCTVAGSPGTWTPISIIPKGVVPQTYSVLTAAPATIGAGVGLAVLTGATAASFTLPKANSYAPTSQLTVVVGVTHATTFAAASGDEVVGTVAVTGTANTALIFGSSGVSSWYRIS